MIMDNCKDYKVNLYFTHSNYLYSTGAVYASQIGGRKAGRRTSRELSYKEAEVTCWKPTSSEQEIFPWDSCIRIVRVSFFLGVVFSFSLFAFVRAASLAFPECRLLPSIASEVIQTIRKMSSALL